MPLLKGSSKEVKSQNISEFHSGRTYAHTLRKFGKKRADDQAIAVALSTARKYARKAEGGADLEDPRMKAIGIRPVEGTLNAPEQPVQAPPEQGSWGPPVAEVNQGPDPNNEAFQAQQAREAASARLSKGVNQLSDRQPGKLTEGVERLWEGFVDQVATPGRLMSGPQQVEHKTPGFETEEEAFLQNLNNQAYDRQMTDFGAGMATNIIGTSRFFKTPENATGIGGAKLKTPEKFFHPYDLDPAELKGAELIKSNSETGGSNPGGVYHLKDGTSVYVKQFQGENAIGRTYNEKLANELLKLAGAPVADVRMTKFNGKPAIVSGMVPGQELNTVSPTKYANLQGLREHYPAHLWTGNYDFVGTGKNNIMVMPDGKTVHIDPGGALRYRAQGALKGPEMWGPNVEHFKMTPGKDLTDIMGEHYNNNQMMSPSAKRVAAITDQQIHDLVQQYGPLQKGEKAKLEETLKARRDGVAKLYEDKGGTSAPPTGGGSPHGPKPSEFPDINVPKTPAEEAQLHSDKASAKFLLKTHGDNVEGIAKELWDLAHELGPNSADGIVKHLPHEMYPELDSHLDAISTQHGVDPWKPKQEPDLYAMGDDMEPPQGPEGWGHANDDLYGDIKFKPGPHFWDNAPAHDEILYGKASSADIGKLFDKAANGEPSPFRKIDPATWQSPYAHQIERPKFENITPEQAKKRGFITEMLLAKGVKSASKVDHPESITDPKAKNSGYLEERALYFFPKDKVHPTSAYGSYEAKPYVVGGNVWEGYYPRLRGEAGQSPGGVSYSDSIFKNIIKAANEHKIDALILHGVSDIGAGNQTQILVMNVHGTLRATNAKFQNLSSNKPLDAILAAGSIPVFYEAMKKMGGGDNKDDKMARGGKVKFKPFSSIETLTGLDEGYRHKPYLKPKDKKETKHFARGGATEPEPKDHEFINFAKGGMINSNIPGRTDKIPMKVATGAYVLPADIPSALGQGNSSAGKTILDKMFNSGPYGLPLAKGKPSKFQMPHLKGFADGGRAEAEKVLPEDHELGMKVPKGGSMCANCSFYNGKETLNWEGGKCNNKGFAQWHGSDKLPQPADEYCCDLYAHHQKMADGGATDHTPIIAAGGEYIIGPDEVMRQGNGSMTAGHRILDAFTLHVRKEHIKTLKNLKGPK